MGTHSRLSPSAADRWTNCPGSIKLSESCPPLPKSKYAAEGSVAHELADGLLSGRLSLDELSCVEEVSKDGFDIEVTDEMKAAIIEYVDFVKAEHRGISMLYGETVWSAEAKVTVGSVDPELKGTLDFRVLSPEAKMLKVYDFKYGKGYSVEVEENVQLSIYALGVLDGLKVQTYKDWDVELVIVQPRAPHAEGSIRRWTVPPRYLDNLREALKENIQQVRGENPAINPGPWCRWCPAEAFCNGKFEQIQDQAKVEFAMEPVQNLKGLPNIDTLSVEKLAAALNWEDDINSWYEALRARALMLLESGQEVPGYKLVEGRSNRKYVSESAVIKAFAPVLGEEQLFEKKLLSPAKLEKIVGKGKLEQMGLTFKPAAPQTIARDTDPRPESSPSAIADFS